MKKLATLALGFTLVGGTSAYADTEVIFGDFHEGPGAEDRYTVRCGAPTELCASVDSIGFFDDNILEITLKCKSPKQSGTQRSTLYPPDPSDTICVYDCSKAQLNISCTTDSEFCDEDYEALVECVGESIDVQQTRDQ
jgi:hypothetical protein